MDASTASGLVARATHLPFALPDIGDEEVDAVVAVLRSDWITTGPVAKAFEDEFAPHIGVKHPVALNSWTAAFRIGLEALGADPGPPPDVQGYAEP